MAKWTFQALGMPSQFTKTNLGFKGGSGGLSASGLKGIVRWSPSPEILAEAVEGRLVALLAELASRSEAGKNSMQTAARGLASQKYELQTPRAAPGITAARGGTRTTIDLYLYHGSRTIHNGHYYGRNLERSANQHGSFSHDTAVIMPTILRHGPQIMKSFAGALNGSGGGSLQNKIARSGFRVA